MKHIIIILVENNVSNFNDFSLTKYSYEIYVNIIVLN